jgi:hypothetical protein
LEGWLKAGVVILPYGLLAVGFRVDDIKESRCISLVRSKGCELSSFIEFVRNKM